MSTEITRTTVQTFQVTPVEVAEVFCSMNEVEQVEMLNHLAKIAGHIIVFQLQYITDNPDLSDEARRLMSFFGDYAYATEDS
jgi:hypothetical protein